PRGEPETSRKSQDITYGIKAAQPNILRGVVARLEVEFSGGQFGDFLGRDVTLVPAPRRTPLVAGALWPANRICDEFIRKRLARETVPYLARIKTVPKSAWAAPGERPTARTHIESMTVESTLLRPAKITVVDDVVTKGNTLLAACSLLKAMFPEAEVRAF